MAGLKLWPSPELSMGLGISSSWSCHTVTAWQDPMQSTKGPISPFLLHGCLTIFSLLWSYMFSTAHITYIMWE